MSHILLEWSSGSCEAMRSVPDVKEAVLVAGVWGAQTCSQALLLNVAP